MDLATGYSFRNRSVDRHKKRWFTLNKKITTLIEHDDHYEVQLPDWYINANHNGKFNEHAYERQMHCQDLNDLYNETKKQTQ